MKSAQIIQSLINESATLVIEYNDNTVTATHYAYTILALCFMNIIGYKTMTFSGNSIYYTF